MSVDLVVTAVPSRTSPQMRRSPPSMLGADVEPVCGGASASTWSSLATPTYAVRPDLASSLSMGTASFRGSAAVATPSGARRGYGVVGAPSAPAPCVVAGNGYDVRPTTAPSGENQMTPGGSKRRGYTSNLMLSSAYEHAPSHQELATPTNSMNSTFMLSKSSRSVRNHVQAARSLPLDPCPPGTAPPSTGGPTLLKSSSIFAPIEPFARPVTAPAGSALHSVHSVASTATAAPVALHLIPSTEPTAPSTPSRQQRPPTPTALDPSLVIGTASSMLVIGGLATPTNADRRDMNASLALGMPAFRGSAAAPLALQLFSRPNLNSAAPSAAGCNVRRSPAGNTPSGSGRCFQRSA